MNEHEEYLEMCALYVSGTLSAEQVTSLDAHLEGCAGCRRAFNEFQEIESMGLAALSPELARVRFLVDEETLTRRPARRILARIETAAHARQLGRGIDVLGAPLIHSGFRARKANTLPKAVGNWFHARFSFENLTTVALAFSRRFLLYAAAVLCTVIISTYCYRLGASRSAGAFAGKLRQVQAGADSLETRIVELSRERDSLGAKLQEGAVNVNALTETIKSQLREIASLQGHNRALAERAQAAENQGVASHSETEVLSRKLADAKASLAVTEKNLELARERQLSDSLLATTLQNQVDQARERQFSDSLLTARLQNQLDGLSTTITDRDQTIRRLRELLDYDRDVRNLMGARDLYVAEVTDVGQDGQTEKPFGRIFFTKGKSLIFYAYDLDKEPGVLKTSAFVAWGRRDLDFEHSLPLGIFYRENSTQNLWVLKFDNPKTLAAIDAVFVTVEHGTGRKKPAGKPLLFAYLKVEPNHP